MAAQRLIVFGSVGIDLIFPVQILPRSGDTIRSRGGTIQPGGKGANQAAAACRDKARVTLVGAVGDDGFADIALDGLRRIGVETDHVIRTDAGTGRAAICIAADGHTTVVTEPGANCRAFAGQVVDTMLGPATTLLLQMETEADENADLISRARRRGARIILNLSPSRIIATQALSDVDVLVGNAREIAWLGEHLGTGNNPASIHAALGVTVVRMMGVQGSQATSDAIPYVHMPALSTHMRDTTAAADCFVGVLAAALSRQEGLQQALRRASVAAGLSTTRVGALAIMPDRAEIDAALRRAPWPTREQEEVPG
jgi:ribokinase